MDLYVFAEADHPFAHGGSGYVVSGRMMRQKVENIPGIAAR